MELTFKEFLRGGKEQLSAAGFAEVEAEHLLAHTLGLTRMDLHNPLTVENALTAIGDISIVEETFWKLLDRRCANEPLQYLTGVAYFRHLEIKVGPGVLVPRPESELLVESVLTHIEKLSGAISVVDLGAGSGALALAIATEAPNTHVIAVEKSAEAIYWLKENISFIDEKVRIVESDVSTALDGVKCDVVIANPPYIADGQELPADVRNHEPAIALFGGADGMKAPRLFIAASARLLKPGGFLAIEHHESQGDEIAAVLNIDFQDILLHQDLTGRPRFTTAVRR
ncbi:peptide chain release factor N(5)-glutamine methyltransferase [Candidatus Planktophila versatilis]|uniref:peptide chain release factor N(5)-glutamine methyltransferase n=1 Tax=Candidatus Planktophila versatilis TaxID=1884905 RepID=UPI000BACC529|nr:peptide chain release factor N(5)-glutamine methyltransferase [Candidatus Planktophila versatilis]ASY26041.1 release factor glutamine methyltransferase [Candidatus Planktophila versatilis]